MKRKQQEKETNLVVDFV